MREARGNTLVSPCRMRLTSSTRARMASRSVVVIRAALTSAKCMKRLPRAATAWGNVTVGDCSEDEPWEKHRCVRKMPSILGGSTYPEWTSHLDHGRFDVVNC